ncbi:Protein of unknown function (DUF1685) [Quillaja saponaria]|uniref:Uncharacterized protein n=1 Tax=Quillaja saponaria TaxID=32244 RepID=A0AAD7KRD2_QUISA|nr:Protein of unknown function (DUF1685) [Quillaja saponaria]
MSEPHAPPLPPYLPPPRSRDQHPLLHRLKPAPLYKQRSWSPDAYRDEAWLRRKGNSKNRRSKSVTDEDLDELKACIELGFGFDSSPEVELDQRLSDTLPALGLYYAVNKNYNELLAPKSSITTTSSSPTPSECETPSPLGSPHTTIFGRGDNPQTVKTRLRQWAQVVACAVRQNSS